MSLWENLQFQLATQYIFLVALVIIIFTHILRLHYLSKTKENYAESLPKCWKFDVRHSSCLAGIAPLIIVLQNAIIYTHNRNSAEPIVSDQLCVFAVKMTMILTGVSRFAMHSFVFQRTKIHKDSISTIWHKIGAALLVSDVLFVLAGMIGIPAIDGYTNGEVCFVGPGTSIVIFVWFAVNDVVIGVYCMLVFVLPLRKLIKVERELERVSSSVEYYTHNNGKHEIAQKRSMESVARRILIFSAIALMTSVMSVPLSAKFKQAAFTIRSFDNVLNAACICMQFCPVDISALPGILRCYFRLCPCCIVASKKLAESAESHSTQSVTSTQVSESTEMPKSAAFSTLEIGTVEHDEEVP